MKIVAVISQKGGTGKTTLSLHLAVAAERSGKSAAVIDLDPQASATSWKDQRQSVTPAVVSAQFARLNEVLKTAAAHGADLTIIDTAPHSESASLAAARAADLVIIPCRPAILDLRAIGTSIDLAKLAEKSPHIVFTAVPPRGRLAEEATQAVAVYGAPVAPVRLCYRAAFIHALTAGQTAQEYDSAGKAATEVSHLYMWMCGQVGL